MDKKQSTEKKAEENKDEAKADEPVVEIAAEPSETKEAVVEDSAPEEEVIDTSSKPKTEETKEEKPAEAAKETENVVKLSAEEEAELNKIIDEHYNKRLAEIYEAIIKKADFLIKMQVPESMAIKDDSASKEYQLLRAPTYFQELEGIEKEQLEAILGENFEDRDWKTRLKQWRASQLSEGVIKDFTEVRKDIFESANMSILALLQTPIPVDKISKKVESVFLNGCRRMAGMFLFAKVLSAELPNDSVGDVTNWMVSGIRNGTNSLSHYLNNIQGCGNHIEFQIRTHFFSVLKSILAKLKKTKDEKEAIRLLDALQWKFQGRDFMNLQDIDLFKILRFGDGSRKNILKRAWGHALKQEVSNKDEEPKNLSKEILTTFENLFINLVSRIVDNDSGDKVSVKSKGTSVPQFERAKSVIDTNASENLLGTAFEVLFKELDRYVQVMTSFEGIDWATYVRVRNKMKKDGREPDEPDNVLLLDEEREDAAHKKAKEARKKKREAEKEAKEKEAKAEEPKPVEDGPVSTTDVKVEVEETKKTQQEEETKDAPKKEAAKSESEEEWEEVVEKRKVKVELSDGEEVELEEEHKVRRPKRKRADSSKPKEESDEEKSEAEDGEKANKNEEETNKVNEQLESMAKQEMELIHKVYAETYIRRVLRLVELFTSVALTST